MGKLDGFQSPTMQDADWVGAWKSSEFVGDYFRLFKARENARRLADMFALMTNWCGLDLLRPTS